MVNLCVVPSDGKATNLSMEKLSTSQFKKQNRQTERQTERKTERKIQEEKEEDKKVEIRRKRIGLKRRKISRVVCSDDGAVNL